MTVSFLDRVWRVSWDELAEKVVLYLVSTDAYGNSIVNKKIKTIKPGDIDYPTITDGRSLVNAAVALVEKYSSKTTDPQYFIGTK